MTITNSNDPLLQKILDLAKANPDLEVLWLYGSQAKGTANVHSDYDLAVAFKYFPKNAVERRLRPEILAIDWNTLVKASEKISIVDINLIPISLAWEVIRDGIPVVIKNPMRLIQEELRISSMYEVDLVYHRKRYAA